MQQPQPQFPNGTNSSSRRPKLFIPIAILIAILGLGFTLIGFHNSSDSYITNTERAVELVAIDHRYVTAVTAISTSNTSSPMDELIESILDAMRVLVEYVVEQTLQEEQFLLELEQELERLVEEFSLQHERRIEEIVQRQQEPPVAQLLEQMEGRLEEIDTAGNGENVSWSIGGWNWSGDWNLQDFSILEGRVHAQPIQVVTEFSDITAIDIVSFDDSIRISSGGDMLIVRHYEWIDNHYTLTVTNGRLSITHNLPRDNMFGYNILRNYIRARDGQNLRFPPIEIIIPESFNIDDIRIRGTNGSITFSDIQVESAINVTSTNGSLQVIDSHLNGRVEMDTTNGSITTNNSTFADRVTVRTTNGSINTTNSTFRNAASLSSTNGSVTTRDSNFTDTTSISTTNGGFNVNNSTFGDTATLRTTNGSFAVRDSTFARAATLSTTNGNLRTENNTFQSTTSVTTSNGSITVTRCTFTELNVSTSRNNIRIELPNSVEYYDIQFSGRGRLTHNGRRLENNDLRNPSATNRIIVSSSASDLIIVD